MENTSTVIPVKIVFYSTLQKIAQTNSTKMDVVPNTPLLDVLITVQETFFLPKDARILKANNDALDVGMICLVNDVDFNLCGGMRHKISEPTNVTLISSLHGG